MENPVPVKEEYTYQVGKIQFIVTPVYKDKGESMRDILLKLMLADLRYNIHRMKPCSAAWKGGHH